MVRVKYFGRHKGGAIRDGVLVAIIDQPQTRLPPAWSCDTDAVIAEWAPPMGYESLQRRQ
jgi:hypothetical protein